MSRSLSLVMLLSAACGGASMHTGALAPGVLLDQQGELGSNDRQVTGGAFADRFEVVVPAGARVAVEVTATTFDPTLEVRAPAGEPLTNDDWNGERSRSRIELVATAAGRMKVQVSSYGSGSTGAYHLVVSTLGGAGVAAIPNVAQVDPASVLTPGQHTEGALEANDATFSDGSFADTVRVASTSPDPVSIYVLSPSNDTLRVLCIDAAGHSVVQQSNGVFVVDGGQAIRLQIIGAAPGRTARWALSVVQGSTAPPVPIPTPPVPPVPPPSPATNHGTPAQPPATTVAVQLGTPVNGTLAAGDLTLTEQEFADAYAFDAPAGARMQLNLTSASIDTYLIVIAPDGARREDDDGGGGRNSTLTFDVPVAGHYVVYATSYGGGEAGPYMLSVAQRAAPAPPSAATQTLRGQLKRSDPHRASGELADTYRFNLTAGSTVRFEIASTDFDTFLIVAAPTGQQETNDDIQSGNTDSALDYVVQTTGPHLVVVSSYRSGMMGNYVLTVHGASGGTRIHGPPPP